MPPQLFRSPRPFPAPVEPSPPLDPASMPPAPAPPLAAENPYAMNRVDRAWGMAMIGLHAVICMDMLFSIWPFDSASVPQEARFWMWLYLCFAAMMGITFVDICYDSPPQELEAAAAVQLPPPPPEMDMC